jgi:hypothetical protein
MSRCVDGPRDVTYCHCCTWCLIVHALYGKFIYVVSDPLTHLLRGWGSWLQGGGKIKTATPLSLHFTIAYTYKYKSWLSSNWITGLSFEGLACARKCFTILQNVPLSCIQMDWHCVKRVERTLCSMILLCFFRQPFVLCCRILPKFGKESENPSSRSLLTFHVFAQLSHLVAVRQGVCCSYLTCSCQDAILRFLKGREEVLTDEN